MSNKEQITYEKIFKILKDNIIKYLPINNNYNPREFHSNFEPGMAIAFIKIFTSDKIKYCLWHLGRSLETNLKKFCNLENEDINTNILFKCALNLSFIDPNYVVKLFNIIKQKNNSENFIGFLNYFENTYLIRYEISTWNYFEKIEHTKNNCCESYNNKISSYFNKKPIYLKLIYILRKEEGDISKENLRLVNGIWNSKKKYIWRKR